MSKKKHQDNRKSLLIRYKIDEKGLVNFIDPCCDTIPAELFGKMMVAISDVQKKWNKEITNKDSDYPGTTLIPEVDLDEPQIM